MTMALLTGAVLPQGTGAVLSRSRWAPPDMAHGPSYRPGFVTPAVRPTADLPRDRIAHGKPGTRQRQRRKAERGGGLARRRAPRAKRSRRR